MATRAVRVGNSVLRRCYTTEAGSSSVLKYSDRTKPEVHGQTVEHSDHGDVVPLEEFDSERLSARHKRLHPHTLQGKTTGGTQIVMPAQLSNVVSEMTLNYKPQDLRRRAARYFQMLQQKGVHQPASDKHETDTHLLTVFLQAYASIYSVLNETRQRMGKEWRPQAILDVGFGPSTGMVALNEILADVDDWNPVRKQSVIIGHSTMKRRAKALLRTQQHEKVENALPGATEPGIEGEPDDAGQKTQIQHTLPGIGTGQYDLIIATHQLFRSEYHFPASVDDRTGHLLSLLAPGGVLVLIERGDPNGFESIARARQIMLRPEDYSDVFKTPRLWKSGRHEDTPTMLKVLAPCAHHGKCPLQVDSALRAKARSGFFNWCRFGQMVQRPKFTIELKKGKYLASEWDEDGNGLGGGYLKGSGRPGGSGHETASHSYLIVKRMETGNDGSVGTPDDLWPRILRTPMKRDKHVVMEVCSPSSQVEQWTVTKGYSKQAYHDARKADGGDLWPLGAKTVQQRGGNRSALAKSAKVEEKNKRKAQKEKAPASEVDEETRQMLEQIETTGEVDTSMLRQIIVDDAWSGRTGRKPNNANASRGVEPREGEEVEEAELEAYFEEIGREFERSARVQRQIIRERKAKAGSKW
ncbi:probable S-adenosyl-L-methionine-dependent RNA methyltransferase Rsm22p, mitochondrial [Trichomonascus vanleenenianus]|uniref:tRNA methyltransferase RSM22 n=1 Tax=Trichomonascus vanleenenianus TaxID=2268995 RepID=UPI003EC960BB